MALPKQDLIAALAQRSLVEKAVIAPTVFNVSKYAVKGAKSIGFPKKAALSVVNRTLGSTTPLTAQYLATTQDTLNLDQNANVHWMIDANDDFQSSLEGQTEMMLSAVEAHAKNVDQKIIAEMMATYGTLVTGAVSKDNILAVLAAIKAKGAENIHIACGVDTYATLLGISDFVDASKYGSSNIPNGVIGKIYGAEVRESRLIAAGKVLFYSPDGIALGVQKSQNYGERAAPEFGSQSKLCTIDMLFGVKSMHLGEQGVASNLSPMIGLISTT